MNTLVDVVLTVLTILLVLSCATMIGLAVQLARLLAQ